jgi:uncharacterized membrane protein
LLWSGTAASAIDLNPTNLSGVTASSALGTNGTDQVGMAIRGSAHAVLWRGGQSSAAIDLDPTALDIDSSYAYGISGDGQQQVGVGNASGGPLHAIVWDGDAQSAVDLNPLVGYISSEALGTNGQEQVGDALYKLSDECNCTRHHAMLWDGTAQSAVDLQLELPSTISNSEAYSIDAAGNVFGVAYDSTGGAYAVEWSPAPEPTAGLLLLFPGVAGMLRRPGCRRAAAGG